MLCVIKTDVCPVRCSWREVLCVIKTDVCAVRCSPEAEGGAVVTRPLYELGQNDACLSMCWLPRDPKLLLAGMHRNLAIFDLRNTSQKTFVNTKAIQGVTVDPHFPDRVASFFEGQVVLWDLRKLEKPVLTLTEQPKPLTKVRLRFMIHTRTPHNLCFYQHYTIFIFALY